MTLFWIYVVTQLVSTAYGVTVINSVRKVPALRKRLREAGYTKRDKGSLYIFNDGLKYFFKGFIPFYYAYKAIQLVNDYDPIGRLMDEEIANGNYITKEDESIFKAEEEQARDSIAYDPNAFLYENVDKYKARKIDLNEIYDEEETPIDYITREFNKDDSNKITPFVEPKEEKPNVVVENKQPEIIKIESEAKEVTNQDIAKAISNLNEYELKELSNKLISLAEVKKNKELALEKDVA